MKVGPLFLLIRRFLLLFGPELACRRSCGPTCADVGPLRLKVGVLTWRLGVDSCSMPRYRLTFLNCCLNFVFLNELNWPWFEMMLSSPSSPLSLSNLVSSSFLGGVFGGDFCSGDRIMVEGFQRAGVEANLHKGLAPEAHNLLR